MPSLQFELSLWQSGSLLVAGLDEAGRGAWAGPVAAGAVILPAEPEILSRLKGVRDSKLMSAAQRAAWEGEIKACALSWAVGLAGNDEIDTLGIVPATRLAMHRALTQLVPQPVHLLLDAVRLSEVNLTQTVLIKGDRRVLSIAAASVLAKTTRDAWMIKIEENYHGYGFDRHKGYGTRQHQSALDELGICPLHRRSFAPVKKLWDNPNSHSVREKQ